jgi:hypothetical protein
MKRISMLAVLLGAAIGLTLSGCGGSGGGTTIITPPAKTTPTVTVTPSAASITTAQPLTVTVAVSSSSGTPTGNVTLTSGSYTSSAATLSAGSASISIAAGALAAGIDSLTVTYTPDSASSSSYNSASGTASVTVTGPSKTTPTVTVTPASSSITVAQSLAVTVAVSGAPTGTVTLTSGSYSSSAVTLSAGGASITIPAGSLAVGTDTLTVAYTPDSASSSSYNSASGTASVAVTALPKTTPTLTVAPSPASITTAQALAVTVTVSGSSATPTGSVTLSSGSYTSAAVTLSSGSATINLPAGSLAAGTDTLTVSYTPDTASSTSYNSASGTGSVVVTALATPALTVTPSASNISTTQVLTVTVAVASSGSYPTPTGSVKLTSGSYSSTAASLSGGSANITVPAGSLATGSDTLTVTYTPDTAAAAYYNTGTKTTSVTVGTLLVPTVTVTTPTAFVVGTEATITVDQSLSVTVAVSSTGNPTPTGSVTLSSGSYTSAPTTLSSGSATITIPAGSLLASTDTLTVTYTPDANSAIYTTNSGTDTVTVDPLLLPTVTVTPSVATAITTAQSLPVVVTVSGSLATPTGTVKVSGGGYTSAATTLSSGSASFNIPGSSLGVGSFTLSAVYTPDTAGALIYHAGTGSSGTITVTVMTNVTVNQTPTSVPVTNQLLGMNMASWSDPTLTGITTAFEAAGIKAVRWPGGSWSDDYHWANNSLCGGTPNGNATFANFLNDLARPAGLDVALTANYGTNATCNGPGQPSEAAAWVAAALNNPNGAVTVSHMTVGNEEYGTWETDKHTIPNDATTYAAAVAGTTGYYQAIKAASPNTLVGVDVNPGNTPAWDPIVLANAPYDFVEYHFYPESPDTATNTTNESDSTLIYQDAQLFTTNIKAIRTELATAGKSGTPIYVGEIGSVYTNPGKQSWSITQGLYAGEVLGEAMNDGISRLTWWIGFGNCNGTAGYDFSSVYGWQTFGAYNIFSDGPSDSSCPNDGPIGTMSPAARAFQLFSQVAVNGEYVLTPTVAGDTTDIRAYAATHNGGTALVLFNLNETTYEPVTVTLSTETSSSDVSITTYNKLLYDQTDANPAVWAAPTVTDMNAQTLPLTLTLTPWSMNVVIIK